MGRSDQRNLEVELSNTFNNSKSIEAGIVII